MELKIIQWNIGTPLYPFRKEGIQLFPYSIFHKQRIKFVEKTINKFDPDVICLQEYLPGEIDLLKYPYSYKVPVEHYPILQVALFSKIPFNSFHIDPKGAFILGNIANINIASFHLNTFNSALRVGQIERVLGLIKSGSSYLFAGDFNMHQMFKKFFHKNDCLSHGKICDNLKYRPKNLLGSYLFTLEELDYFYHSHEIKINKIKTIRNYLKILTTGMDHFPTIISCHVNEE